MNEWPSTVDPMSYSDQEKDRILRDYFSLASKEESPRCPGCGEVLQFAVNYSSESSSSQIQVSCPDCQARFTWEQSRAEQPWKPLHLAYFLERYRLNDVLRCPFDDCFVTYTEFSDAVIEFRCPYCNRRKKTSRLRKPEEAF